MDNERNNHIHDVACGGQKETCLDYGYAEPVSMARIYIPKRSVGIVTDEHSALDCIREKFAEMENSMKRIICWIWGHDYTKWLKLSTGTMRACFRCYCVQEKRNI